MAFWIGWGFDAAVALVVIYFFFAGLADGSVSSFNAGLWTSLLAIVATTMVGSLWLRSAGRRRTAWALLLVLGIPGLGYALFVLLVLITQPRWN